MFQRLAYEMEIKGRNWKLKRFCYSCGTTKTRVCEAGDGHLYYKWYPNHDDQNSALCEACYFRLIDYPKRKEYFKNIANPKTHAKWSPRRLNYKGTRIHLEKNPRTGICSDCGRSISEGEINRTNLHHFEYDDNHPLDNTIELCVRCHKNRHRLGEDG